MEDWKHQIITNKQNKNTKEWGDMAKNEGHNINY